MKKSKILMAGAFAAMLALGLALAGCPTDSGGGNNTPVNNPPVNNGPATVNLQNQHGTDTIYWFEMKNGGVLTIGEAVEIKPFFSKQFQVPPGTYIAGVNVGNANDLRQCTVSVSGGQMVTLVYNGGLSQQ